MALLLAALPIFASAGELSQADIEARVQPPLHVAARLPDLPAWPITSELEPESGPVAYVFESIDLAPIPGFEGTPFNLLITLDRDGRFVDVEVLRQHEPVFLSGLGEEPLHEFVRQYAGKSLHRPLTVSSTYDKRRPERDHDSVLDGVAKATASVRILNQTVLNAGLAVARARLGFAQQRSREPPARPRLDVVTPQSVPALIENGAIARLAISNRQGEALFADTEAAGLDEAVGRDPDGSLVSLAVAYLNAPTIGQALLGEARYRELMDSLRDGQQAFWIATRGRTRLLAEDFVPGTVPPDIALYQDGLSMELRDFNFPVADPPGLGPSNSSGVFVVPAAAALDPASRMAFELSLHRSQGTVLLRTTTVTAQLDYQPPADLFVRPPKPPPEWLQAWLGRTTELLVIATALVVLTITLARPRWISVDRRRLWLFRNGFLMFTLAYIGWYAQGQLSIVQVTGAIKSVLAGAGLASFLYDPVSLLLIGFTALSFFLWGRGTFCGWLCPFGAMQEFAVTIRQRIGLRAIRIPRQRARQLARLRYLILGALMVAATVSPTAAERLVEVEPFKTAITVAFDRAWPYVLYAVAAIVASAFVYKAYCRFLCPLGAAMEIGGRLRILDWLPRRDECGQPCQTCRHRCAYDAIDDDGSIRYADCFQCLDCVGIYHDVRRCAPLLLRQKKLRRPSPAKPMADN